MVGLWDCGPGLARSSIITLHVLHIAGRYKVQLLLARLHISAPMPLHAFASLPLGMLCLQVGGVLGAGNVLDARIPWPQRVLHPHVGHSEMPDAAQASLVGGAYGSAGICVHLKVLGQPKSRAMMVVLKEVDDPARVPSSLASAWDTVAMGRVRMQCYTRCLPRTAVPPDSDRRAARHPARYVPTPTLRAGIPGWTPSQTLRRACTR